MNEQKKHPAHSKIVCAGSVRHRLLLSVIVLAILLCHIPFVPFSALSTRPVFAEDPPDDSILSSGGDEGWSDYDDPYAPSSQPEPLRQEQPRSFIGDPPLIGDEPVPLSETAPERAFAPVIVSASVGDNPVKVRTGPGLEYEQVYELQPGAPVILVGRSGAWVLVREADGQARYWVASDMLDMPELSLYTLYDVPQDDIPQLPPTHTEAPHDESQAEATDGLLVGTITEPSVSVYAGPGSEYEELGTVDADVSVTLLAHYEDWFQIELEDGSEAWVFGELLAIDDDVRSRVPQTEDIPALPESPTLHASGDVAGYALHYVGSPYVYGGTTPAGFDCSGFVQYVYAQHGVHLPRTAASQFTSSPAIEVEGMENLLPGDILFFVNTSTAGISHVAIYTGDGRMVHAVSPGVGVAVSNVWDTYWVNHYHGAVRVRR